ncbi:unnamed protein product [Lepidochelys kempii]
MSHWELLHLVCKDYLSLILLPLDQEKAFHRVDYRYLMGTLQAFGFRLCFVGFLQMLYISVECLVKLNWALTESGTFGHQGCPLSGQRYSIQPFLYLLCKRMTGLVLQEPDLQVIWWGMPTMCYSWLRSQDLGDLAQRAACQDNCSAASFARVSWVKSSSLMAGELGMGSRWAPSHPRRDFLDYTEGIGWTP